MKDEVPVVPNGCRRQAGAARPLDNPWASGHDGFGTAYRPKDRRQRPTMEDLMMAGTTEPPTLADAGAAAVLSAAADRAALALQRTRRGQASDRDRASLRRIHDLLEQASADKARSRRVPTTQHRRMAPVVELVEDAASSKGSLDNQALIQQLLKQLEGVSQGSTVEHDLVAIERFVSNLAMYAHARYSADLGPTSRHSAWTAFDF